MKLVKYFFAVVSLSTLSISFSFAAGITPTCPGVTRSVSWSSTNTNVGDCSGTVSSVSPGCSFSILSTGGSQGVTAPTSGTCTGTFTCKGVTDTATLSVYSGASLGANNCCGTGSYGYGGTYGYLPTWDAAQNKCVAATYSCSRTAPTGDNLTSRPATTANGAWTYASWGECTWSCNSGYKKSGNSCVPDTYSCSGTAPTGGNFTSRGATAPNGTWTYATSGQCTWSCNSGYKKSGNSCVVNQVVAVGCSLTATPSAIAPGESSRLSATVWGTYDDPDEGNRLVHYTIDYSTRDTSVDVSPTETTEYSAFTSDNFFRFSAPEYKKDCFATVTVTAPTGCSASTAWWSPCGYQVPAMTSGQSGLNVLNYLAGYTGSANFSCSNGTRTMSNATCNPITYSCTGTLPANTTAFPAPDNTGLGANTAYAYSATDTTAKCQYKCVGTSARSGSSCVTCSNGGCTNNVCNNGAINPPTCTPKPTVNLSADNVKVSYNTGTTLRWAPTNSPTSCTATVGWTGSKAVGGGNQATGNLTVAKTYNLQCSNAGGSSALDSVTVTPCGQATPNWNGTTNTCVAGPSATITVSDCTIASGASACYSSVSWTSANLIGALSVRQNGTPFSALVLQIVNYKTSF